MAKRTVADAVPTADAHTPECEPARRALTYRNAFMKSISEADIHQIISAVVARAKDGDLTAARLILDRVCGAQAVADWPSSAAVEEAMTTSAMLEGLARLG